MYEGIGLDAIAPLFFKFFVPYGCSVVVATPPVQRQSPFTPQDGPPERERSQSINSRWTATLRRTLRVQITELFAADVQPWDNEATQTPRLMDPSRPMTGIEMYQASRRLTAHSAPDSVDWKEPPFARRILPCAANLQFSRKVPGSSEEKSTLWNLITSSTDVLLERWSQKLFISGKLDGFKEAARGALSATASEPGPIGKMFKDGYAFLVRERTLLDYFLPSIEGPQLWNWYAMSVDNFTLAKFLASVLALMGSEFFGDCYRRLRWDSMFILRKYSLRFDSYTVVPWRGQSFLRAVQLEARRLLLQICGGMGLGENYNVEDEDLFEIIIHNLNPDMSFYQSAAMATMMARVAHVFGIERLGLGALRDGTDADLTPHPQFGSRVYPKHIIAFSASILIGELIRLSFSTNMHGLEVYETRVGPSMVEQILLQKCVSALDTVLAGGGSDAETLESILCGISYNLDGESLLKANKRHLDALVDKEKLAVNYKFDHTSLAQRLEDIMRQMSMGSLEDLGYDDDD